MPASQLRTPPTLLRKSQCLGVDAKSFDASSCALRSLGLSRDRRAQRQEPPEQIDEGPGAHHGVADQSDQQRASACDHAITRAAMRTSSNVELAGIQNLFRDVPPRLGRIRSGRQGQTGSITTNSYRPPPRLISASEFAMAMVTTTDSHHTHRVVRVDDMTAIKPVLNPGSKPLRHLDARWAYRAGSGLTQRPLMRAGLRRRDGPTGATAPPAAAWCSCRSGLPRHPRLG